MPRLSCATDHSSWLPESLVREFRKELKKLDDLAYAQSRRPVDIEPIWPAEEVFAQSPEMDVVNESPRLLAPSKTQELDMKQSSPRTGRFMVAESDCEEEEPSQENNADALQRIGCFVAADLCSPSRGIFK